MKKFEGILLCSDLDGTLLRNDKTISKENIDAIEYFKSEGGKFTFVTGRMPFFVTEICETVNPNVPFGCINGGGLYDYEKEEYVWKQVMSDEVIPLVEYIDKNLPQMGIQVNTFEKTYFCKENSAMEIFRRVTNAPNYTCDYTKVKEPISKIIFASEDEKDIIKIKEMLASHPLAEKFNFIQSEKILYEILPKGIGKGTAISKLVQLYDIDINKTIAVGDFYNDISMFNAVKTAVAVFNACDEVKENADYITVSNEQHAIFQIIDDLEKGKLKG